MEARPPHRPVPRSQGDGQADDLGTDRSEDWGAELSSRYSRDAIRPTLNVCPSTAGGKIGRHELPPADGRAGGAVEPIVHGFHRPQNGTGATARCGVSCRCPTRTIILASLPPTTCVRCRSSGATRSGRLSDRCRVDGRGIAIVGDIDRTVRAHDVRSARSCGKRGSTSAQGYPSRSASTANSTSPSPRVWAEAARATCQPLSRLRSRFRKPVRQFTCLRCPIKDSL